MIREAADYDGLFFYRIFDLQTQPVMKTIPAVLIIILCACLSGFAQTVLYQDNMESYPLNSYLAVENPTWWGTWSGLPGSSEDIQVKSTYSLSGVQAASIDTVGGPTDGLLLLGDKFTGAYELKWWMYIESGKCGYYNIQHFETPGIEYAMHIFFRADGTFELTTGGQTYYGTYPKDTWFEVRQNIDLDVNYISLYINGTFIHDWPFSYQIYYTTGTKQLGSVDFGAYAVSGSNESPQAYIDDVTYTELPTGAHPTIELEPSSIATSVVTGSTGQEPMTVDNTGVSDLTYDINIIYDADNPRVLNPGSSDDSVKLHYDGDHYISIGWSAPPVTVTVAARFPNDMTLPYAGMELKSVEVFVDNLNSGPNNFTVRIFGMGNEGQPGTLLTTESFTPAGGGWDTIVLSNPVMITGEDIWVAYTFTQTDPGIYIPGVDAGPLNPNGDFLNTGGGWVHLSNWPGFSYNWNIRANLEGVPSVQWLSADPLSDTIGTGNTLPVSVNFDASSLTPGQYHATLRYLSNDPLNPQVDIPVSLDVVGVGIDEGGKNGLLAIPNPATERVCLRSSRMISQVTVSDIMGKIVYSGNETCIDISKFQAGLYVMHVVTDAGVSDVKFVKSR